MCCIGTAGKGTAWSVLGLELIVISQVLSHRRIFVFGELLAIPSVQSVRNLLKCAADV